MSKDRLIPYLLNVVSTNTSTGDEHVSLIAWDERRDGRPTKGGLKKWVEENQSRKYWKGHDINYICAFSQRTSKIICEYGKQKQAGVQNN